MAIAGIGLVITLGALIALVFIGKKSVRALKLYNYIKQKIFWNGLIRYVL